MRQQDQDSILAQIAQRLPMAKGSVVQVRKPCIRSNCRACASGRKHPAFIFSFRQAGRQRCMYVPEQLVALLRRAIANGRWMEQQMGRMGAQLIEDHRKARGKGAGSS